MDNRNGNMKYKTEHLILRKAAIEVRWSQCQLGQNKVQSRGQCAQSLSGHKVMQQANIINMITNKYEPQQKHCLGTVKPTSTYRTTCYVVLVKSWTNTQHCKHNSDKYFSFLTMRTCIGYLLSIKQDIFF